MTVLCESCSRPIRRKICSSQCSTSVSKREFRTPKSFRSTKGASKARRDHINAELQTLRSLLPISEQEMERLSYLHTMALVCFYIREAQLFPPGPHDMMGPPAAAAPAVIDPELLFSLPGFILALTANGKLAYISENVSHFLGFSVVELLAHGDSIFDLLSSTATRIMQEKLCFAQQHPGTEIEFVTEMRTLRAFQARHGRNRSMAVRGRFLMLGTQLTSTSPALTFVAFCTPIEHLSENRGGASPNSSFQSQHTLDMKIAEVKESVIYHLGYQKEELIGQSWYNLLHPEDAGRAAELHRTLIHGAGKHSQHMVVRMLCKNLSWAWVQVDARRENGKGGELVICTNHILSEEEAFYIQSQEAQHGAISTATPNQRHCIGEIKPQTPLKEVSLFLEESMTSRDETLKYNSCQPLDACEEQILPAPLQPPLPTSFPVPSVTADVTTLQSPPETGFPFFPADWHKNTSCLDGGDSLPSSSPYTLCSPESTYSPDNSPSVNFSPLFEERPPTVMFPATGTSSDLDKWAISVLAEQIHSLAEIFSQYTKQIIQEPPSISCWPGQPIEDTHLGSRQDRGTNGDLNFPEELPVDEEIINGILNNLLDNDTLSLPTSELGSAHHFDMSDSDSQLPLVLMPLTEATPCLSQCHFLQPLSSSASSDSHVPESQWDGRFQATLQQGAIPEEAMFC
ncbi:neuronal PAS domain-containing protein 4-like [Hemicordylus capensis]|uniref:neuronal PAS domain-containing protein 4-like n=1 Tax=Hemicordylus capensis TaxID=884348 RepID=UPI0023024C41|nr:neuronal PAS domain-containing protein 4-like [Hemicordylus capensis]